MSTCLNNMFEKLRLVTSTAEIFDPNTELGERVVHLLRRLLPLVGYGRDTQVWLIPGNGVHIYILYILYIYI